MGPLKYEVCQDQASSLVFYGGLCVDMQERKRIIEEMRIRLNEAVKMANGDLRSPEVYALSRKLDHIISEYMALTRAKFN